MFNIPGITGWRRSQGGEFRGLDFAQNDRAGFLEEAHGGGVILWDIVRIDRRSHRCLHPRSKENVFEPERDAVQRTPVVSAVDFLFVLLGGG